MKPAQRWTLVVLLIAIIGLFFYFDLGRFLTLEYLQQIRSSAVAYVDANPVLASIGFFLIYVLITGLSLPGAAVMTLAAGAVFGVAWGLLLVSFASSLGATLAFLLSRSLLRDWVQTRFGAYLQAINAGLEKDGNFYLFSLRMVPLFPFFVVNLLMGLTPMKTTNFYLISQLGMLPGTFVFVFAGTQLAQIRTLSDVLDPGLILALSLLGLFPLLARKVLAWIRTSRREDRSPP